MPRLPRTLRLILLGGVTLAAIGAIAAVLLVTAAGCLKDNDSSYPLREQLLPIRPS